MTDDLRDSAVLYALGLLEAGEAGAFEADMKREPELAELVAEYEAVAAVLSFAISQEEPPAHIRKALMHKVRGGDEVVPPIRDSEAAPVSFRKSRSRSFLPWAAAATFAILSAILFVQLRESEQRMEEIVQQNSIENYIVAVLDPQTEELPNVSAKVAWNEVTGTGILDAEDLPDQGSEKDYQLWIFDGDNPAPVSAGIFDPTSDGRIVFRPERSIGSAAAFAVSIESAGGNPQPAGPVILVGKPGAG